MISIFKEYDDFLLVYTDLLLSFIGYF